MTRRELFGVLVAGLVVRPVLPSIAAREYFVDSSPSSLLMLKMLHGKERIVTETEAFRLSAECARGVDKLAREMKDLPDVLGRAVREARGVSSK
jgi:hypothetical protein